jgi:hypothetical protein
MAGTTVAKNQPHIRLNAEEIEILIVFMSTTHALDNEEEALLERLLEARDRIAIQTRNEPRYKRAAILRGEFY